MLVVLHYARDDMTFCQL